MLRFNELYVTEDGKHLVIDVEIEDYEMYDSCYISNISVNTAANRCGNKAVSDVVVHSVEGIVQYDMNGDGVITEEDCELYNRLVELLGKVEYDSDDISKYDVNQDGIVDGRDIIAIADKIHGRYSNDSYLYDVNEDGEINFQDMGVVSHFIETCARSSSILTEEELSTLLSLLELFKKAVESPVYIENGSSKHIRKCLDWCDLGGLVGVKGSLNGQLFIVTVTAECDGTTVSETEQLGCGWDKNTLTGVAFNGKPIYDAAVRYASAYGDTCDNSDAKAFEDFVLRYNAFDFALRLGDVCQAWYYYSNYLSGGSAPRSSSKGCGCYGTY